jgi:carnitine 3-dehydrogenase
LLNTSNKKFKKVAVIGTGVIGTGWIIRFLAHDKIVYAFDKNFELYNKSIKEIKRTWPHIKKFFGKTKLNLENLKYCNSIEEATKEADFIQECVSENYPLKTNLMRIIDEKSKRMQLFHLALQVYFQQEFMQNVKIQNVPL